MSNEEVRKALESQGALFQSSPVAVLTGKELGEHADIRQLRKAAVQWYRDTLQGKVMARRADLGDIRFTQAGRKEMEHFSADPDKLKMVPALLQVIEQGEYIREEAPVHPRRDGVVKFHIIEADVALQGEAFRVRVEVAEDKAGNKFYDLFPDAVEHEKKKASKQRSGSQNPGEPGGSPEDVSTFNQSMSNLPDGVNISILRQKNDKLGFFRQADGHVEIGLLEKANLSTFIHESGHQWLEELRQDAARPDAPEQLRSDWETVRAWLGVEGETITVDQHEQFARGVEAYMMEGKAPSAELHGIFQRFMAWLKLIYKELRRLNVELTPEVREVFDRLLATDEEIARAEDSQGLASLFATAEDAGMTAKEFTAYQETAQEAGEARREALRVQFMKEVKREREAWWKEERARVREEVTAELQEEPVYQAVQALTKGKTFDGEEMPVKLDRSALVAMYGEDMLKRLPKGSAAEYAYTAENGIAPDVAAEMFGFSSGDELVQKMIEAPRMSRYIVAEADRRMKERHGDLIENVAARADEAMKAAHNDVTGDVLRAELRAIRRKAREVAPFVKAAEEEGESLLERERQEREYERRWLEAEKQLAVKIERGVAQEEIQALRDQIKADKDAARRLRREGMANMRPSTEKNPTDIPPLESFKEAARQIIGNKPVKDVFPHVYQRAEAKAAKATETALAKQDFKAAAKEKQRQILNHFLYKEAVQAREEAEKILAYAKRLQSSHKQSKLGLAGEEYQEQINAILAKYEFAPVTLAELGRRAETMEKWIQRHEEETGIAPEIPEEVLTRALKVNYRELSMDELRAVNDALKNIDHLSKLANRIIDEDRVISMEVARTTLLDRVETSLPTATTLPRTDSDLTIIEDLSRKTRAVFDIFLRPETLIEWLDGGTSGPFHRMLWNRYRDSESNRQDLRRDVSTDLVKVLEETSKESGRMAEKFFVPSLNRSLSRYSIIGVALNMGNESNLDKLMRGGEWRNGEHIEYTETILNEMLGHLTEADWRMVKGLWDTVERLWPHIEKAEKERTGLVPPKIKPRTVVTPFGEIEGGYWPVVFDSRFSSQGIQQAADMTPQEIIGQIYKPAATKHGFTNERTDVARPMQLDWHRILSKHIDEVITHVSFWNFVYQTRRLLMDSKMRNVLQERLGETRFQSLEGWLRYAVRQDAIGDPAAAPLQKLMDGALTNTAVAALGFKVTTAWGNVAVAYVQAADRVNPMWQLRGVSEFLRHPKRVTEAIKEISPYMRHREDNLDQSYVTVMNKLAGKDTVKARLARVAMSVHRAADFIGSFGIWQSAFRMATLRDGMTVQEAVRYADKVISTTQQAGAPGDLSAFERDPRFKALRMFIGPMIIMENRLADIGHFKGVKAALSPEAWGQLLAYWFMPALVFEAAVGRGPDDDEEWWAWAVRKWLTYPTQMFPFLRETAPYIEGKVTGHRSSFRMNPVYEAAKSMADFGAEAYRAATGEGDAEKLFKSGVRASGPALGVPYQFEVTGSYLTDLMTGEYTPENPYEAVKYLFVRRPR